MFLLPAAGRRCCLYPSPYSQIVTPLHPSCKTGISPFPPRDCSPSKVLPKTLPHSSSLEKVVETTSSVAVVAGGRSPPLRSPPLVISGITGEVAAVSTISDRATNYTLIQISLPPLASLYYLLYVYDYTRVFLIEACL